MEHGQQRGKWLFLSVVALVAGGLGALAIWAFGIRDGDGSASAGPAAPLTQAERETLAGFHELATEPGASTGAGAIREACDEVGNIIRAKPFGAYDTSAYPDSSDPLPSAPLPGTAHWAATADLATLGYPPRLLRQLVLRAALGSEDDAEDFAGAVRDCHGELRPALEAATA